MAIRKCPQCLHVVSPGVAAAYSDSIECAQCKTPLEVATVTRMIAIWAGLAIGVVTWMSMRKGGTFGWALTVLLPFLAFAAASAFITMMTADLRKREVIATPEPASDSQGHGGHGDHGAPH